MKCWKEYDIFIFFAKWLSICANKNRDPKPCAKSLSTKPLGGIFMMRRSGV
jgi:hypothetical protein